MLTPKRIQDLADPIESIYIAMTNELLVNIGRHITKPTWTHTVAWEIQKLSELGQLTQENAAIINRWIKSLPEEVRATMEQTRREALEDIEKQMEQAAQTGYITPPARDSTLTVLEEYIQQSEDKLNLVNTTMLQSSLQQYSRMVQLTAEIERQAEQTQAILNEAAGSVASGTETRTQALNRAIRRISEEGLTGFYDKAGRSWSPEAYVNMDIRTTVHNVAIQSVKNRMEDYGTEVFQVSAHAGARPLCYPYQGKMYSWDNTYGEIEDGNGRLWKYEPVKNTTYGQAAGLFGVNCGHDPIVIVPGVSIPHAQDYVQPKELNDKEYAESQQQRALERKIRAAKRALEMGENDPEAKARVRAAQAEMRQFIKETGRTRRPDREQLYGGKKAPTPPKDQRPTPGSTTATPQPATQPAKIELPPFTPAKTREEAETFANQFFADKKSGFAATGVNYDGIDVGVANRVNKTLFDFYNEFDVNKFGGVVAPKGNSREGKMIQNATAAYSPIQNSFFLNRKSLKTEATAEKALAKERELATDLLTHPEKYDLSRGSRLFRQIVENAKVSGRTTVPTTIEEVLFHELGHSLEKQLKQHKDFQSIKDRMPDYAAKISGYATTETSEYIAESFASWKKGESVADPLLIDAFISFRRKQNG